MAGHRSPSSRAFTLVELLVVIGIIGLLVGILLPSLSRARQQANATKCAANLRQIVTAAHMYANDNKGKIVPGAVQVAGPPINADPLTYTLWWGEIIWGTGPFTHERGFLSPYLGQGTSTDERRNLTLCPTMVDTSPLWNLISTDPRNASLAYNHYGANQSLNGYGAKGGKLSRVRNSTQVVWFADGAQMKALEGVRVPEPWLNPPNSTNHPTVHARHAQRTANVAWVDGHVSAEPVRFFAVRPNYSAAPVATLAERENWAVGDLDVDLDPATIESFKSWND